MGDKNDLNVRNKIIDQIVTKKNQFYGYPPSW